MVKLKTTMKLPRRKPLKFGPLDVDYTRRAVIPIVPLYDDGPEFEIIVYGRTVSDLLTVPNETVHSIARRYPDCTSLGPFAVREMEDLPIV